MSSVVSVLVPYSGLDVGHLSSTSRSTVDWVAGCWRSLRWFRGCSLEEWLAVLCRLLVGCCRSFVVRVRAVGAVGVVSVVFVLYSWCSLLLLCCCNNLVAFFVWFVHLVCTTGGHLCCCVFSC